GGIETATQLVSLTENAKIVFQDLKIMRVNVHDNVPPQDAVAGDAGTIPGGEAVHLWGVDGGVVQYCTASYNGSRNLAAPDRGVAFSTYYCNHILFQNNEAHHLQSRPGGDEGGFDFDIFTTNSIMQFNYSHDNDGYGYML